MMFLCSLYLVTEERGVFGLSLSCMQIFFDTSCQIKLTTQNILLYNVKYNVTCYTTLICLASQVGRPAIGPLQHSVPEHLLQLRVHRHFADSWRHRQKVRQNSVLNITVDLHSYDQASFLSHLVRNLLNRLQWGFEYWTSWKKVWMVQFL